MNIHGFQLSRETEVGEYCSVYSALELESSKTVTIRAFHQELSSNIDFCQHVKNSSKLLLNKVIGNITPIKQAVPDPAGCYIISEYFPCSHNEAPLLTEFTLDEILGFGLQLANSLSQLHALGLVHGGVSRSNLLFPNFTEVTLGPISFQRTFKKETAPFSLPVSLEEAAYIAPEFSSGLTASSDFYSLGVVLFELLFKTKPFTADSLQQLQLKKEAMQFEIPDAQANKLAPLFNQLLNNNPDKRISNTAGYIKAVEQSGYSIGKVESPTEEIPVPVVPPESNNLPTDNKKNIIIGAAIAAALVIAIALYLFTGSSSDKFIETNKVNTDRVVEIDKSVVETDLTITTKQPDNKDIANSLYQKSVQQVSKNNYGSALMSINNALKVQPDHSDALKLKKQIELEFEVRAYLSRAEKFIEQKKLTQPEKDNAFYTYTKLATILPAGDNRVNKGFQKIANSYYQLANDFVLKKQFDSAKKHIATGLSVIPDYASLKQLELYIRQQEQKKSDLQEKLKTERSEKLKAARLLRQQKKELENKRLAALEKEKTLKIKQRKEREKTLLLQQKQRQIDLKFSTANNLLSEKTLSQQSLDNALNIHAELMTLALQDPRTADLFNQIIRSYSTLASTQKEASNLPQALNTINQGLALDRKNQQLLQLKNEVNTLLSETKQKEKQVPIIGTF